MKEKEFGKISRDQFKQVLDFLSIGESQKNDLDELISESPEKLSSLIDSLFPWSYFYEMPENYMAALYLHCLFSKSRIQDLLKSADPNQALLDFASSDIEPDGWLNLEKTEDLGFVISLTMAYIFNLQAYKMGKPSINSLIHKIRGGDDDALLEAVYVDRMSLTCPSIAKRIARATLEGDEDFFVLLSKSITKTRPKKPPDPKYDTLRFGLELLEQAKGLDNIPYEDQFVILVEELQLYPYTENDTFRSFERFVQRLKAKRTT